MVKSGWVHATTLMMNAPDLRNLARMAARFVTMVLVSSSSKAMKKLRAVSNQKRQSMNMSSQKELEE